MLIMGYSVNQCTEVLSTKPFGTYDEVWMDNVVCRTVHIILALVRPDVSPGVFFSSTLQMEW